MTDDAQLVVDESLFLTAIVFLNDRTETFELLRVVGDFTHQPYLAARFKADVGREIGQEERRAIEDYVAAVYVVHDHNLGIEDIREILSDFQGPALDFVRLAAWAFLTAWTQRYGGTHERQRVDGKDTLIDPNL